MEQFFTWVRQPNGAIFQVFCYAKSPHEAKQLFECHNTNGNKVIYYPAKVVGS